MSQSRKVNANFAIVGAQTIETSRIIVHAGAVTQATSITTRVNLPSTAGIITTVAATTGTSGTSTFTAAHDNINMSTVVLGNIIGYTGNGLPTLRMNTTVGSMTITIQNTSLFAPLNAPLRISYLIL